MDNEFGYLDLNVFDYVNKKEQKLVIVNKKEKYLELKVKDVEKFNTFDFCGQGVGKLIETKVLYAVNSFYQPMTLYRCSLTKNTLRAIPYSIITSSIYIIGNKSDSLIKHFTNKTKVKKMRYYNENIQKIFPSKSVTVKRNNGSIYVDARKGKEKVISRINHNGNKILIKLIHSFQNYGNINDINIKRFSYFELWFQKSVNLDTVLTISSRLDSLIHLFLLTENRSNELTIYDTKQNAYEYYNLNYSNEKKKDPVFYLGKREENIFNFNALFNMLIGINDSNSNSFFPFINYDRKSRSVEIQFLEYFRVLEYTDTERRKKEGKGPNKLFLLDLLKKYPTLKDIYFQNQSDKKIENEIRALRNYYSHNGYYIKKLPVYKGKMKRLKQIDTQWLFNVKNFVKAVAYLEIYDLAGIKVEENHLITYLH